jgi:4,5-dihydroxyphthalate decarboxylase
MENKTYFETLVRYHQEQGLSKTRLAPEDLFAREALESFKI